MLDSTLTPRFYISTAINYTNGSPHLGHTYEVVCADFFARYHRLFGDEVFFLTGTDEHGQKVATAAARESIQPIQICDRYAALFQKLGQSLDISNDFFIRTTFDKHVHCCQWLWRNSVSKGDIYLGCYEGWYNEREETFVPEAEAFQSNYLDTFSGKPLIKTKEPSYFFKLSKYQDALLHHINTHPDFILPLERRAEILHRLQEPLLDLSISRTTFSWGIPVPDTTTQEKHVIYVWFDALINYLSALDLIHQDSDLTKFWPCDVHLIGKDIAWFHAVIWPCILFSCGLPLPKTILCHGFVNGPDGRKESKSLGNVTDPFEVIGNYNPDALRYFLLREGTFGCDFNFNKNHLIARHDSELQACFGNLVQRGLKLCESYCGGVIPAHDPYEIFPLHELKEQISVLLGKFQIESILDLIFEKISFVNTWIHKTAPWTLKAEDQRDEQQRIIRTILESIYVLGHFLSPVIPNSIEKLFFRLNHKPCLCLSEISNWWNLNPGIKVLSNEEHLFPRIGKNQWERKKEIQQKRERKDGLKDDDPKKHDPNL